MGCAAAQPSLWVHVSAAGWRASHALQGFVRNGIVWRLENIIPRHSKCIFFRLVLHSTSLFSQVVKAAITQQNYNCRYPFSEALPLLWTMLVLNMSAQLRGGSQQLKPASWLELLVVIVYTFATVLVSVPRVPQRFKVGSGAGAVFLTFPAFASKVRQGGEEPLLSLPLLKAGSRATGALCSINQQVLCLMQTNWCLGSDQLQDTDCAD